MKSYIVIFGYCLFFALLSISWVPLKEKKIQENPYQATITSPVIADKPVVDNISALYAVLNLEQQGLSKQAFEFACKGYQRLQKKRIVTKDAYLVICDFSQSSNNKRLYLIDMVSNKVVFNTYVAHGRNSGGEYATRFSNKLQSLQSSLGFYVTENTYYGEHGLSLRMKGLESGFNDKAYRRRVVVHGADYIGNNWLERNNYMGRSYGCPAIPKTESNFLINTIKNGSCLFIYHPSKNYLRGSKILNG